MRPPVPFKLFAAASIVFLLLSSLPALAAPPSPAQTAPAASTLNRLRSQVGDVQVSLKRGLGTASFVGLPRDCAALDVRGGTFQERAYAFFGEYGDLFGMRDARSELVAQSEARDLAGGVHIPFAQAYRGIPVFGGQLLAHFGADGRFLAANGAFVPDIALDVVPALSATQAAEAATRAVAAAHPQATSKVFSALSSELLIYRTGLVQGVKGQSYLAYRVEVGNGAEVRDQAFVDAASGAVLDRFAENPDELHRELYNQSLQPSSLVWQEGAPFPTGNVDWDNEISGAQEVYNLFGSLTNGTWLSYNGNSATMKTVNDDPTISCPNANWNGVSTNYCTGVSGDDTVAHEWGHAYTEYTHNLIYAWQPGALNEGYSDIWGEVVDLLNGRGKDSPDALRSSAGQYCSTLDGGAPTGQKKDNTYRWLSGEDDPAFGNPIRDLWKPECHRNPGKVTSSLYVCQDGFSNDVVHGDSGIPGHAFALLTDGGSFNGLTITGIGLTKAANIYWQAQRFYQTNTTDFADHADALEASCQSLIGKSLYELKTTGPDTWGAASPAITATDCQQVTNAIAAVELRTAPSCSYAAMFTPNPPALCTNVGDSPQNHLFQDFEAGLSGWTTQQTPVHPDTWNDRPWHIVANAPEGHLGSVAFGPDPVVGDCAADLENGVTSLLSPVITIPANAAAPVKMAWDHLVSIEIDYDGGNLKASVNGGAFTLVPASAFTFNPYNSSLTTSQNDDPMAGQTAWTGGDEGAVSSKWGQSQIDLSQIGVDPGDSVQFRWDVGSDGCNGWAGWYLDDVRVYSCAPCSTPNTPGGVAIAKTSPTNVNLSWAVAGGASQYEVWTAENVPYLDPTGKTCTSPGPYQCSTTTSTAYSAADLGSAPVNHSYVVRSANACGQTSGPSNRTGEFEFDLVKGG